MTNDEDSSLQADWAFREPTRERTVVRGWIISRRPEVVTITQGHQDTGKSSSNQVWLQPAVIKGWVVVSIPKPKRVGVSEPK